MIHSSRRCDGSLDVACGCEREARQNIKRTSIPINMPKVQVPEQVGVLSDSERKEGSKIRKGGKTSMRDDDEAEF